MEPAPKEVQVQLNTLPKSFTASEIGDMYRCLKTDVDKLNKAPGMTSSKLRSILGQKHKIFQYSYPGVFMKTIMGELNEVAFLDMLDTKSRLDFGDIDLDTARNRVIDGAKANIKNNPKENRPKKVPSKGTVVQEIKFSAKPDDL